MKPSPFLDALNGAFANELRSAEARRVRPGDSKRRLRLVLDRQGLLTSDRRLGRLSASVVLNLRATHFFYTDVENVLPPTSRDLLKKTLLGREATS